MRTPRRRATCGATLVLLLLSSAWLPGGCPTADLGGGNTQTNDNADTSGSSNRNNVGPPPPPNTNTNSNDNAGDNDNTGDNSNTNDNKSQAVAPLIAALQTQNITAQTPYTGPTPTLLQGTAPITWSLATGPSGMSIAADTGVVSWANSENVTRDHVIRIIATNAAGFDDAAWTLRVKERVDPTVIADIASQEIGEAEPYTSAAPTLISGSGTIVWQLIQKPAGMTIASDTGVVTWPDPTLGAHPIVIRAIGSGGADDEDFTLTVKNLRMFLASRTLDAASDGVSQSPTCSGNGQIVAFTSTASNLDPDDQNGVLDVFMIDRGTGLVRRVSEPTAGGDPDGISLRPAVSNDGRFIAFDTMASNLSTADNDAHFDVYVFDRLTGTLELVSVNTAGKKGNAGSIAPAISSDGRFIAFESDASNLVSDDTLGVRDVFVRDRGPRVGDSFDTSQAKTVRVSVRSAGFVPGVAESVNASISADGRFVVFESFADNLVDDDDNNEYDVFVHDRDADANGVFDEHFYFDQDSQQTLPASITERVSVVDGGEADGRSGSAAITSDGRFVAFQSGANNLVSDDPNVGVDVFIYDRQDGQTILASRATPAAGKRFTSINPSISADGRYVTFESDADVLVAGDTNKATDVFVFDRVTNTTQRLSVALRDVQAEGTCQNPFMTPSARFIVFESTAPNLVPADVDSNGALTDVFVRDRTH